jgi:hypothetical protein
MSVVLHKARPAGLTHESTAKTVISGLAGRPGDYQKLGIDPVEVAQFEDRDPFAASSMTAQSRCSSTSLPPWMAHKSSVSKPSIIQATGNSSPTPDITSRPRIGCCRRGAKTRGKFGHVPRRPEPPALGVIMGFGGARTLRLRPLRVGSEELRPSAASNTIRARFTSRCAVVQSGRKPARVLQVVQIGPTHRSHPEAVVSS